MSCHEAAAAAWQGSQHARAMQHATAKTVLGDFSGTRFSFRGVESTFFKRDGKFFVRTDGPGGRMADFEVKYTFGLHPLQQYLVELPGGRLQALALSWDARPRPQGGQRWFRQYPGEKIDHRDELHWTRRAQNWNFMCADCHSTRVSKGYDASRDTFDTRWAEIAVGCEACHGPGSAHVEWSKTRPVTDLRKGLTVVLDDRRRAGWVIEPSTGTARRSTPRGADVEVEVCAPCHARRAQIAEGHRAGDPLLDHYLPATLAAGLFHADGQQRDEVFVWNSFRQTRMYEAGVSCSDCHEPHGSKLRALGNAVCAQCHLPKKFDAPGHHRHAKDSSGAQCVNCHMPANTYMVVDRRRDHAIRVPRPDLSLKLDAPNACNACHRNKSVRWAADTTTRWYGNRQSAQRHYGEALAAGQRAQAGAAADLLTVAGDRKLPAIVRATAIELLAQYPGRRAAQAIRDALADVDPQVRLAAAAAWSAVTPPPMTSRLAPLLRDPVRAVRSEAARQIAASRAPIDASTRQALDAALDDYEANQRENLDRPEAQLNVASVRSSRGDLQGAERALRSALQRDPAFVPAYANLSDLLRSTQRETQAEQLLREGLRHVPAAAALRVALGLSLVRQGRKREALVELAAAYRSAPELPRVAHVYALALDDSGRRKGAIGVLAASARRAGTRDVLLALAALHRDSGHRASEAEALRALAAVNPDDPALHAPLR